MPTGNRLETVQGAIALALSGLVLGSIAVVATDRSGSTQPSPTSDSSPSARLDTAHTADLPQDPLAPPLTQKWSVSLAGAASDPLVVDGTVFITDDVSLRAIDLASGSPKWAPAPIGGFTSGVAAVAYDGGMLFVVNDNDDLEAFSAQTGVPLWSLQLAQGGSAGDVTASSGTVYESTPASLYAVSETTGKVIWTQTAPPSGFGSGPPAVSGGGVYVANDCGEAYGFDAQSGTPLWPVQPCPGVTTSGGRMPSVWGDQVFSAPNLTVSARTGATTGGPVPGGYGAVWGSTSFFKSYDSSTAAWLLEAMDTRTQKVLWTVLSTADAPPPIVVNSTVYTLTGILSALDPQTGGTLWSAPPPSIPSSCPPVMTVPRLSAGAGVLVGVASCELFAFTGRAGGTRAALTSTGTVFAAGIPVPLNVVVSSIAGTPVSGTVILRDGSTPLATLSLSNGLAQQSLINLSPGAHLLSCQVVGTSMFAPSTCNTLPVMINPPNTTTTLKVSNAVSPQGSAVTVTADVIAASGLPTGDVQFTDNGHLARVSTLVSGVTQWRPAGLSVGRHDLAAHFLGGHGLQPSTSAIQSLVVETSMESGNSVTPPLQQSWKLSADVGPPLVGGRDVFVVSTANRVTAYSLADGSIAWGPIDVLPASTLAYDSGRLYVVGLHAIEALDGASGRWLWGSSVLAGSQLSSAAVGNGALYLTGDGTVYAVSQADGSLLWSSVSPNSHDTPTVSDAGVYVTAACSVRAFDPHTGMLLWNDDLQPCLGAYGLTLYSGQLWWSGGSVIDPVTGKITGTFPGGLPTFAGSEYFVPAQGRLEAHDIASSALLWAIPLDVPAAGPIVNNGIVYVASSADAKVSAFDILTGQPVWAATLGSGLQGFGVRLAIGDGSVVVSGVAPGITNGGYLWTFNVTPAPLGPVTDAALTLSGSTPMATWNAPVDTGGSPVTAYAIYLYGSDRSTRLEVTSNGYVELPGLSAGTYYTFTVTAWNDSTWGPWCPWTPWWQTP